ncbi:chemotaxis protein CheC [Azospirillum sp. SYSU D00513]|uniref:chemotaxis protein CheC n=1 Tax=Azospirillum sp. SYSU D00513 TaxID=2812561 RepID=UPI001A974AD8|nr:chemotaxis protein CheC [Azospirillum sp. SYSU D00513]
MTPLDALERDALTELGNIGTARASTALSRMVGSTVRVSVPTVEIQPAAQAALGLDASFPGRLVVIAESVSGIVEGAALLAFAESSSLDLVQAVLPPGVPPEDAPELEHEALCEVGNIVLNGCLSTIANMLKIEIQTGLPAVQRGTALDCFAGAGVATGPEASALIFHVAFVVEGRDLTGRIVLALDARSFAGLKTLIGGYIARVLK